MQEQLKSDIESLLLSKTAPNSTLIAIGSSKHYFNCVNFNDKQI